LRVAVQKEKSDSVIIYIVFELVRGILTIPLQREDAVDVSPAKGPSKGRMRWM
jgi:hypothetical protein